MNHRTKLQIVAEALDQFTQSEIIEALNGDWHDELGGIDALRERVFEAARERIWNGIDAPGMEFNRVVGPWNHQFREYYAAYSLKQIEDEIQDHNEYVSDLRRFAEAGDKMDYDPDTGAQTTLDLFLEDGGLREPNSQDELRVIVACLAVGEEPPENIYELIGGLDVDTFFDDVMNAGSIDTALEYSRYDSALPRGELSRLAPPDEWPDDLDPLNTSRFTCPSCHAEGREVYTEGGERAAVQSRGRMRDLYELTEGGEYFIPPTSSHTPGDRVCSGCVDFGRSERITIITENGEKCRLGVRSSFCRDFSYEEDGFDTATVLDDEAIETAIDVPRMRPNEYIELTPDGAGNTPVEDQREVLERADSSEYRIFNHGPIFVNITGRTPESAIILVPRDDVRALKEVKNALERPGLVLDGDAENETSEGLGDIFA